MKLVHKCIIVFAVITMMVLMAESVAHCQTFTKPDTVKVDTLSFLHKNKAHEPITFKLYGAKTTWAWTRGQLIERAVNDSVFHYDVPMLRSYFDMTNILSFTAIDTANNESPRSASVTLIHVPVVIDTTPVPQGRALPWVYNLEDLASGTVVSGNIIRGGTQAANYGGGYVFWTTSGNCVLSFIINSSKAANVHVIVRARTPNYGDVSEIRFSINNPEHFATWTGRATPPALESLDLGNFDVVKGQNILQVRVTKPNSGAVLFGFEVRETGVVPDVTAPSAPGSISIR